MYLACRVVPSSHSSNDCAKGHTNQSIRIIQWLHMRKLTQRRVRFHSGCENRVRPIGRIGLDQDERTVRNVLAGRPSFYEPGLEPLAQQNVAGRLPLVVV